MKFIETSLKGVLLIEPDVFRDHRGFFLESYNQKKYCDGGIKDEFLQDNHSSSVKNSLRGLHMQIRSPQVKLVRVLRGTILDVVVDVRRGSPTFKKWEAFELSDSNFRQIYVPGGFAHGFLVLSEMAEVEYKVSTFYDKSDELGIIWNDRDVGIRWPTSTPILSAKDSVLPQLRDVMDRLPEYAKNEVA